MPQPKKNIYKENKTIEHDYMIISKKKHVLQLTN